MTTKRASVESTADAYLELLAARGVEYFFANSGTDFAPLIDAYARRLDQGLPTPRPMTIPHEVPAVGMAHGYALVTGRPQVVMVHVIVGAGNAVGGIINAARSNVMMPPTALPAASSTPRARTCRSCSAPDVTRSPSRACTAAAIARSTGRRSRSTRPG